MAEIYHRGLGGRVTWIELTRDEVEHALASAPWEWSASPRGFEPWPPSRVRGEPVEPPSLADARPANSLWSRE